MTTIDPFGLILGILRADTGVTAIASTRISSEPAVPPVIRLLDIDWSPSPFGSARLGLQSWRGVARCVGADNPTGAITARQLAGAVVDALHDRGMTKDASDRLLLRSYTPNVDGMVRDPDTKQPYYDVPIEATVAREAIA